MTRIEGRAGRREMRGCGGNGRTEVEGFADVDGEGAGRTDVRNGGWRKI